MESVWLLELVNLVFSFVAATLKTFIGFVVIYQFYGCYLILRYPDGITRWKKTGIKYFPPIKRLFDMIPEWENKTGQD